MANNVKLFQVFAQIRRTQLIIYYQGRVIMNNEQSNRVLIPDFYKQEKRSIHIEFENNGQIDYAVRLRSSMLRIITPNDIQMRINEKKHIEIEIQMNNHSRQEFVLNIDFVNNKRQASLTFVCETSQAIIDYSATNNNYKEIVGIGQSAQMQDVWDENQSKLKPIEHEITLTNTGRAAAVINFNEIVSRKYPPARLMSDFHIEPDNFTILPAKTVPVRFVYQPMDLRILDAEVKIQSNSSPIPLSIPFYVEFETPILKSTPRNLIDIGEIKSGSNFLQNMLTLENIGKKELRFSISESKIRQSFVKSLALEVSSGQNQTIKIIPNRQHSISVKIDCDTFDNNQFSSSILELAEIELTSLCDPVMNMNGKLTNRSITLVFVGHTKPLSSFALAGNKNYKIWSALNCLPAQWLYGIYKEHSTFNPYIPLITLTAIAHVCGSDKTKPKLPETEDDWSKLCNNLSQNQTNHITLNSFTNESTSINPIDTLTSALRASFTVYHSFFYHSQLFHSSFNNIDSIRLQLMSVINSTESIDEGYAMQEYVSKFWNIFESSSSDNAYQQAIDLIHTCVSHDCAMPEHARTFTNSIHQLVHSSLTSDMVQKLANLIPSTGTFREVLTGSLTSSDLKWTLLFGLISDQIKQIMIRLIKKDYEALIDLHLISCEQNHSFLIQRSMLNAFKNRDRLWNELNSTEKSHLLSPLFIDNSDLFQIIQRISDKDNATLKDLLSITRVILKRSNLSENTLNQIENIFQNNTQYSISTALRTHINMSYTDCESLAHEICSLKKLTIGYPYRNPPIVRSIVESYYKILHKLVTLTSDQWKLAGNAILQL